MSSDLDNKAIKAAISNNWSVAIESNLKILEESPKNVEALNRLAHAYKEMGDFKLTKKTYRLVLSIDRFNPIAIKNLKLLENLSKSTQNNSGSNQTKNCPVVSYYPQTFLEEPGKTKVVALINIAPLSTLLRFSPGDQVDFSIRKRTVVVISSEDHYLGALPDDLSAKLIRLIKGGNHYQVFVKTVAKNSLCVLIKEVSRASRFKNQPTFPIAGDRGECYPGGSSEIPSSKEESGEEKEELLPESEETPEDSSE